MMELKRGASDEDVLAMCMAGGRTLLTFDKDFGELAYDGACLLPAHCIV